MNSKTYSHKKFLDSQQMTIQIWSHCLLQSLRFKRLQNVGKFISLAHKSVEYDRTFFLLSWCRFLVMQWGEDVGIHIAIKSLPHWSDLSTIQFSSRMCHLMKFYVKQCEIFYAIIFEERWRLTFFYSEIGHQISFFAIDFFPHRGMNAVFFMKFIFFSCIL